MPFPFSFFFFLWAQCRCQFLLQITNCLLFELTAQKFDQFFSIKFLQQTRNLSMQHMHCWPLMVVGFHNAVTDAHLCFLDFHVRRCILYIQASSLLPCCLVSLKIWVEFDSLFSNYLVAHGFLLYPLLRL